MKTIEITVSPTGATAVQTKGFSGSTCQEASRWIEQALGLRLYEQLTADFYQSQSADQAIRPQA